MKTDPFAAPIMTPLRRYSLAQKEKIDKQIAFLLKSKCIRESRSPWRAPLVLAKKKDGTWRFCVDYTRVNAITIKDAFPCPDAGEIITQIAEGPVKSSIDFTQGYWNVRLDESTVPITGFWANGQLYEWRVMPMGLVNSSANF